MPRCHLDSCEVEQKCVFLAWNHHHIFTTHLNIGFKERFRRFQKILNMQGISAESDVDVIYNVSMPVASTEMVANLKALQEMGAISRETIMEKSEIITDVDVEKKRLEGEEEGSQNSSTLPKEEYSPHHLGTVSYYPDTA